MDITAIAKFLLVLQSGRNNSLPRVCRNPNPALESHHPSLIHSVTHPTGTIPHHHSDIPEHSRLVLQKRRIQGMPRWRHRVWIQFPSSVAQVIPQQATLDLSRAGRLVPRPNAPRTLATQGHYVDRPVRNRKAFSGLQLQSNRLSLYKQSQLTAFTQNPQLSLHSKNVKKNI